jgi:hypothetical protein
MLSDFDLAKQSQDPGGLPAAVVQYENGVRPPLFMPNHSTGSTRMSLIIARCSFQWWIPVLVP